MLINFQRQSITEDQPLIFYFTVSINDSSEADLCKYQDGPDGAYCCILISSINQLGTDS